MKNSFSSNQLTCLRHLRMAFDYYNESFVEGKYGLYIPVGLLVVHTVTLSNKHIRQSHKKSGEEIYPYMVNLEYLKMSQWICYLIQYEGLRLIDRHTELPIRKKHIKPLIKGLMTEQRDDYLALFTCQVAFDAYIQVQQQVKGMAKRDAKIIAAQHMLSDILDQRHLLRTGLSHNDVLYSSIGNTASERDENDQQLQLEREGELKSLIEEMGMESPADMRNTTFDTYEMVWKKLYEMKPDLFPMERLEDQWAKLFFDKQQLCAFDDNRLVELYELNSIRK